MAPTKERPATKTIATNREARHEYFVLEALETGVELKGTEVKSLRAGGVNLKDSWVDIEDGRAASQGNAHPPHTTTATSSIRTPCGCGGCSATRTRSGGCSSSASCRATPLGPSNFTMLLPLLLLSFLNLFFTSETAGSSTILIWLLTSTPFDFRNSITSLFCRPSSLASSCTLNFDNRYTSFMIAFAKFSSWTARQARYSFPIALPKLSLSEKKKIGTS